MTVSEELAIPASVSFAIGGAAGVIEVLLQQPSVAWKNAIQDGRPLPWNPRMLYRGVAINAATIAPINGLQFGVNRYLEEIFADNGQLSDSGRTGTATAAGAVSGLVTCPGELLMIQQQKTGTSLSFASQQILEQHGVAGYFRGMVPTVIREAIFTGAYLGVIPVLKEHMVASRPDLFEKRPHYANVIASVAAGVASTFVTQPFDTIKTRMQANLDVPAYRTMSRTAASMMQEGGLRTIFSGLLPRTQRVTCAVFILNESKDHLSNLYTRLQPLQRGGLALGFNQTSCSSEEKA